MTTAVDIRSALSNGPFSSLSWFSDNAGLRVYSVLAPNNARAPYVVFQRVAINFTTTNQGERPTSFDYEFRIYVDRTTREIVTGDGMTDADRIDQYEEALVASLLSRFKVTRNTSTDALERVAAAFQRASTPGGGLAVTSSSNSDAIVQRLLNVTLRRTGA